MRCPLALYRNAGDSPIDLRIGECPGEPPYVYAAAGGETVEGPASYERQFVAAGYVLEKHLGIGDLRSPFDAKPVALAAIPGLAAQPAPAGGAIIGALSPDKGQKPKKSG